MTNYYCPFCSPRYQINQKGVNSKMVCGQCGEQLVKVALFRPVQIFALISIFAFVMPLLLILIEVLPKSMKMNPENPFEELNFRKTLS